MVSNLGYLYPRGCLYLLSDKSKRDLHTCTHTYTQIHTLIACSSSVFCWKQQGSALSEPSHCWSVLEQVSESLTSCCSSDSWPWPPSRGRKEEEEGDKRCVSPLGIDTISQVFVDTPAKTGRNLFSSKSFWVNSTLWRTVLYTTRTLRLQSHKYIFVDRCVIPGTLVLDGG